MYEGPWHTVTISWWDPGETSGFWRTQSRKPIPEDQDVDIDYEWHHPPECGEACHRCGAHNLNCGIEFEIDAIGAAEALGPVQSGTYRVRHIAEQLRTADGTEFSSHLEVVPVEARA